VQSDITDTFEEHVPSTAENIIETQDERGFRKKDASHFDSGNQSQSSWLSTKGKMPCRHGVSSIFLSLTSS